MATPVYAAVKNLKLNVFDVSVQMKLSVAINTENYFKYTICRVILFRNVEKIISKSDWYDGGFRAQTVAYSISYLSYYISKSNKFLNFDMIWEIQNLPRVLTLALEEIAKVIYATVTKPPDGFANITQWCKKEECWSKIKNINLEVNLEGCLINTEEEQYIKKESKKIKKLDDGIEIQSFVIELKKENWTKLQEYYEKDDAISPMQFDTLTKYCLGRLPLPSVKQSKILYALYNQAFNEGFCL